MAKIKKIIYNFFVFLAIIWLIYVFFSYLINTLGQGKPNVPSVAQISKILFSPTFIYEDKDLGTNLGTTKNDPAASDQKVIAVQKENFQKPDYLLFGPSIFLMNGKYQIIFRLKSNMNGDNDDRIARLEFSQDQGGIICADKNVFVKDFSVKDQFQDFVLDCLTQGGKGFETRIEYFGGADLAVDNVKIVVKDRYFWNFIKDIPRRLGKIL